MNSRLREIINYKTGGAAEPFCRTVGVVSSVSRQTLEGGKFRAVSCADPAFDIP